jgi:hypothetical protein
MNNEELFFEAGFAAVVVVLIAAVGVILWAWGV